jgi:hypothetical protein
MQIDLSQKIKEYYHTFMEVWVKKSEELTQWMVDGKVDIRIAYLKKDQLPQEVRPKTATDEDDAAKEPNQKRQRL